jgi:peptide-methionine (S)-S-oxide reductase
MRINACDRFRRCRFIALASLLALLSSCGPKSAMNETPAATPVPAVPKGAEVATLGAGCFWCIEAACRQLPGVISATPGFMGGQTENPGYEQIAVLSSNRN